MSKDVTLLSSKISFWRDLLRLWHYFPSRRKTQLILIGVLLFFNSLAEMLSLGAVVPLLAVLAEPERIWNTGTIQFVANWLGWQTSADILWPSCFIFAAAAMVAGVIRLLTLRASIGLANAIGSDLSIEVFRRSLDQPYAEHLKANSSEVISAIANEVDQVVIMINSVLSLLNAVILSVGLAGLLLTLDPPITLGLAIVFGGCYGLFTFYSRKVLNKLGPSVVTSQSARISIVQEGLGAIRDVILDQSQSIYVKSYARQDRNLRHCRGKGQFLAISPRHAMEAIGLITIALVAMVLSSSKSGFLGKLPLLGALALGAQRLLPTLQLIYVSWSNFCLNQPALHSLLEYLDKPHTSRVSTSNNPPLRFSRDIELRNVSFRYVPAQPWVLKDFNLTIQRGQRIGIVGETGSGKSTLLDLLIGLLEPCQGELLVDGNPIIGDSLRRWQRSISHVPQNIFLSDASIAENIAFGYPADEILDSQIIRAAQQAQIAGFIDSLEHGYLTKVGERGVQLSGGQLQRIGIARALFRRAPLLIFDEATSALDNTTEENLMEAINNLSHDLTIVMIAHRFSSLKGCDRVVRIKSGKIVADVMQPTSGDLFAWQQD